MAHLLVCVRHGNTIFGFEVYSKKYAPVVFDDATVGLAMRMDPCTSLSQFFVIRCIPIILHQQDEASGSKPLDNTDKSHHSETSQHLHGSNNNDKVKSNTDDTESKEMCIHQLSLIYLNTSFRTSIQLPSNVAYCCFKELNRSKRFRRNFLVFVKRNFKFLNMSDKTCSCDEMHTVCDFSISLPRLIEVIPQVTPVSVCHQWCYRVAGLVKKRLILEETMAWLSTLGGGYSSLGDYFQHFSERAGEISATQLRIALELCDPVMAAKCRLFYALSLMQRDSLHESKIIIRREYYFATHCKFRDQRLLDMCKGIWSKLQYLYTRRKSRKLAIQK